MFKVFRTEAHFIIACESIGDYAITQDGKLLERNTWKDDAYDEVSNQNNFIIVNMQEITDKCLKSKVIFGDNQIKIYKYNDMYLGCESKISDDKSEWYIIHDLKQYLYNMCH